MWQMQHKSDVRRPSTLGQSKYCSLYASGVEIGRKIRYANIAIVPFETTVRSHQFMLEFEKYKEVVQKQYLRTIQSQIYT